jgi:hypothetical protein
MKTGIYISGLGQSFQQESVEKYATRMVNEYRYNHTKIQFSSKTEKITYNGQESLVVNIIKQTGDTSEVIYKLYEFKYHEILTGRFNALNILFKNFMLLLLVIKKFPVLLYRTFRSSGYSHPGQTIYLFFIFLIIAASIVFILPVALGVILNFLGTEAFTSFSKTIKLNFTFTQKWNFNKKDLSDLAEKFISFTALLLIVIPKAKVIVTALATEFVSANNYLEVGAQSQHIQGNLDQLVEYIAENDPGTKIHYHSYSFGTLVVLDMLFPFGTVPSKNVQQLSEALITIGTPVEFVKAYYRRYYTDRNKLLDSKIAWLNVYSAADALGTNFRKDNKRGEAEFGLDINGMKPVNLNYEISNVSKTGFINAIMLGGIKAHSIYWDEKPEGLSCLRPIYNEMSRQGLL